MSDLKYIESIYRLYPELVRLLGLCVLNFSNYLNEIIKNTEKSIESIGNAFGDLGSLLRLEFGMGDSHNGGKSVVMMTFESNKVVYKPRNMQLEKAYCELLSWLNAQDISDFYHLKAFKVLCGANSGYMEYIENAPCDDEEDVHRFYRRIGQLLCVLYTLRGCDFHYENLIAQKDHPILIDLETILGNSLFEWDNAKSPVEQVRAFINESVLKTALLPSKIINRKNKKFIDIGGVSFSESQEFPFSSSVIENIDGEQVKVINRFTKASSSNNNPILQGKTISASNYISEIKHGFSIMYTWIKDNKENYINTTAKIFGKCSYRTILKSTNFYFQLLKTSYHPDLLQSSIDRFIFLHRVGIPTDSIDTVQAQVGAEEIKQLYNGDIPYFTALPGKNSICVPQRKKSIKYYTYSANDSIKRCVSALSNLDLSYQSFLIEASFNLQYEEIFESMLSKLNKQEGIAI